jgi:hypothetical protein
MVAAEPGHYLRDHVQAVGRMLLPEPPTRTSPGLGLPGIFGVELGYLIVVYGLGLVGLVWGLGRSDRGPFLLLGTVLVYFAVLSGSEAYARFRVPLMPAMTLLAGEGAAVLGAARGRKRQKEQIEPSRGVDSGD